jgi:hypothetical protein
MTEKEFILLIIGIPIGVIVNFLSAWCFPGFAIWYRTLLNRRIAKHINQLSRAAVNAETLIICGKPLSWIVIERANYLPGRIESNYDNSPFVLEPEFNKMLVEYTENIRVRLEKGENHLPYNSNGYKLREFEVGYRQIVDGEEIPILRLKFGPTTYFEQIVTDLNINNPVRDRLARGAKLAEKPVEEFSSILAINLSLVTKDGFLVVSERSSKAHVAGNTLHTSVGENMIRPTDANSQGSPDPFRAAIRGAQEELGIEIDYKDVKFIAFGVHPLLCQYSLLGWVQINYTRDQVSDLRRLGVPKDKWESKTLHYVPFNPLSVADFIFSHWEDWFSIGLANIYLSLYELYSAKEIDKAFTLAKDKAKI